MAQRSSTIVAGGALILIGIAGWQFLSSSKSSGNKSRDLVEIDELEDNDGDCVTPEEVAQVFDRLFLEMQAVVQQLMQQVQALHMSGSGVPEKQLKSIIKSEMARALQMKQQAVAEEFDMDYDCLQEATWEFLEQEDEYPKVKRAVERFQKLWESTTGEPVIGWRPGMEMAAPKPETVLEPTALLMLAEKYFDGITECMRGLVSRYKTEGRDLKDPAVQRQLNLDFAQNATEAGEEVLQREGATQSQFEASIAAHSGSPEVAQKLRMLQMRQQQALMAMGAA